MIYLYFKPLLKFYVVFSFEDYALVYKIIRDILAFDGSLFMKDFKICNTLVSKFCTLVYPTLKSNYLKKYLAVMAT